MVNRFRNISHTNMRRRTLYSEHDEESLVKIPKTVKSLERNKSYDISSNVTDFYRREFLCITIYFVVHFIHVLIQVVFMGREINLIHLTVTV